MASSSNGKVPIHRADFIMMQDLLRDWCDRTGFAVYSRESEKQAQRIIDWFEHGCSSEQLLRQVVLPPPRSQYH